jgi:hypothetical protein
MGQLNNLYVSSSFQGLMKLTNSATGLTSTLQTIQAGDGSNSPLQMSLTSVNISGSFTVNNFPITGSTSGTAGTSGSSGTSGTSGSAGTSGTSGSSGSSGTSGSNGSSGTSGINGTSGSSGTSGGNGSSGTSGTSGSSGSSGTSGSSGLTGSSGTSGTSGSDGLVGSNGTSGTSGVDGTSGSSGTSGVIDYTGLITTGSITTTQEITGSLILPNTVISGSLVGNTVNGGLVKIGSEAFLSSSVKLNITGSSPISQSNFIFGQPVPGANPTFTGSIVISGSNNIMFGPFRGNTITGGTADTYGYIGGNNNIIGVQIPTLNVSSSYRPTFSNNNLNGSVALTFLTASVTGATTPTINNNSGLAGVILNHQSGSVNFSNNFVGSGIASTMTTTPQALTPLISANAIIGATVQLNHISSSINYGSNIGGITVTNNYSSSVSNLVNNIAVNNNTFLGGANNIVVTGSNSVTRRAIDSNIISGRQNIVNSNYVPGTASFSAGHLVSSGLIGQGLIVSASHLSTTNGGSIFVGRWNATGSLQESSQDTVFVVGTGFGDNARRNALQIDSNNNTRITGSVTISGSLQINGQGVVSGSVVTDRNGLIVTGSGGAQSITGSLNLSNGLNILNNNLSISTGSIQLNNDGQSSISNPQTGRNVLYVDNVNNNFFFGNVPKGQTGRFSGDTSNFILSPKFSNFATGSRNLIFATDNSFFTSGSNNIFIGDGQPFGNDVGDSLYIGMNENSNQSIITKRGGGTANPIQLGFPTQVTGSLNVSNLPNASGSFIVTTDSTGTLTKSPYSAVTSNLFSVGDFYSTQTQTLAAGVSGSVTYNNTGTSFGVTLASSSQLTIANAGVYSITFSAQIKGDGGQDTVYMWLKKNGTNVADTATKIIAKNNEEDVMTVEYIVQAAASDYYEIAWQNTTGDGDLAYYTASGNIPAIPSIITTVKQVR